MNDLNTKCYPSILFHPLFRECCLPLIHFHPNFLSYWPPNLNAEKEKMQKISPFRTFPLQCTLTYRYLLWLNVIFFVSNVERSKRNTTCIGRSSWFARQQKKQPIKQNKKNTMIMIESLLSNNTSNRCKFIMTSIRGKNQWPSTQKWNDDSYLRKNKDCRKHALVTYATCALTLSRLMVTAKVLIFINIYGIL